MSNRTRPKYINSPAWNNGGREVAGWLALAAFITLLTILVLLLTGGDV